MPTVTATPTDNTPEYKYEFTSWSNITGTIIADREITATFTKSNQYYSVTLDPHGGKINSGNVLGYTYGSGATLPTNVTRSGYRFLGWSEGFDSVTGDLLTVARWEKEPAPSAEPAVWNVRFEMNGGELVSGELQQRIADGEAAEDMNQP